MVYLTMNLTCIMLKFSYDFLNLFLTYLPKAMIFDDPYPLGRPPRSMGYEGVDIACSGFKIEHGIVLL